MAPYAARLKRVVESVACVVTVAPLLRWLIVVHAVPPRRSWRTTCPRCRRPFGPGGDARALLPTARCGCGQRLGPPPWTVETVTVASAVVLATSGIGGVALAGYLWWAALSIVLVFVDLAVQRLPARLSYAAATGLLALLAINAYLTHAWQPWTRACTGALIAAAALAACAMALPRLVHWGDVRYALCIGAAASWAGWLGLYAAAVLSTLLAAAVGVVLIVLRRATLSTQLPQGPFLYAATLVVIAGLVVV
jgi:leader peptidase (prepilin peptidase)/N-methyltransferase